MTLKLNHINLFMSEVSSFILKNSDLFWLVKKVDFDLSKYKICFVVFREKKMVFGDKNSDLCLSHKNKVF